MATMDETRSCWGDRLVVSVFLYKELCKENDSSQIFQGSRHFRLEFGTRVAKVMADASPVSMSNFDSPVEGCTQVQHDLQCTLLAGCVMRLPLPVLKENQLWEAPLKEGMRHLVTVLPDRFEGVGFDRLFDPGVRYLFTVGFPRVIAAVGFSHALRLSWYTSEETERKLTMDNLMKIDVLHESSVPSPTRGHVVKARTDMTNWSALLPDQCNVPLVSLGPNPFDEPFPVRSIFMGTFHIKSERFEEVYGQLAPLLDKLFTARPVSLDVDSD